MREEGAMKNRHGFTLIELMIAMVIILISLLGMYKTVLVAIEGNASNIMRDEGRFITEGIVNKLRSMNASDIKTGPSPWTDDDLVTILGMEAFDDPDDGSGSLVPRVPMRSRNMNKYYKVVIIATDMVQFKDVRVVVGWNVKQKLDKAPTDKNLTGKEFEHSISTMVR